MMKSRDSLSPRVGGLVHRPPQDSSFLEFSFKKRTICKRSESKIPLLWKHFSSSGRERSPRLTELPIGRGNLDLSRC
ncbi:hypothetical protein MRB53_014588 [Persea americana]|uniref:Uncharacterized protein n=1 Tax=Persea americana TaxID=3435 RepID=A0ACC2KBB0_PERAE|nr:hypothetical protein MRB53_014588 [Persea americana]